LSTLGADPAHYPSEQFRAPANDGDGCPLSGKLPSRGGSDPTATAGDQCDTLVLIHVYCSHALIRLV
jgi:hypothetical protein